MPRSIEPWLGVAVAAAVLLIGASVRRRRYAATPHVTGTAPAATTKDRLPFRLTEVSRRVGLVHAHETLTTHASLERLAPYLKALAGASVAVTDYDGDGWPDVYLANSALGSKNRLFRNNRDGTFTDVAEKAGIADVNKTAGTLRAVFFDYDNDGRPDLLLTTSYCPKLFHNAGDGTFTDVTAGSRLAEHCGYAYAVNVLDYDRDGRLDVIIADFYGDVDMTNPKTRKFLFNSLTFADNGGPINVYHNEGGGRFAPVPGALGIKSRGWTHAIGVYDLRGTGASDLYFATDFNADQLYFQRPSGTYENASNKLDEKYSHFGMNAEIADVDHDGRPVVFVTDIYEPGHVVAELSLLKAGSGNFNNVALERNLQSCGWSWGAKFVDLDNNGDLDLVVTNGMVSTPSERDYWFKLETANGGRDRSRADIDGWPKFGGDSFSGHQKKCVYYNDGGRFDDVSVLTGMRDDDADGRGLAAIDYLNNGSISLVEAVVGGTARFYRNDQDNGNAWIGFKLIGSRSNRDAFGARVRVELEGKILSAEVEPANGLQSQSDSRLHFGLGGASGVKRVVIRWPSGTEQTLTGLKTGFYHTVKEPR